MGSRKKNKKVKKTVVTEPSETFAVTFLKNLHFPEDFGDEHYDPKAGVSTVDIAEEMSKKYEELYSQPKLPPCKINVAKMVVKPDVKFFICDIRADKKETVKDYIQKLGGTVTNRLGKSTRVLFYPSERKMNCDTLFVLLTAAVGGRFLLPAPYIYQSFDEKKFLNVNEQSSLEYIQSKHNLHKSILTAIKVSIVYRNKYSINNALPAFHRQIILFAVPEDQAEDVKLLLEILGARVQPYFWDNMFISNQLFTLCVTDGKIQLPDFTKTIPKATPNDIRNMLWAVYDKFSY